MADRRSWLETFADAGVLGPLDVEFARVLRRMCPGESELALLGAAFASRAIAHGHVCADLRALVERPLVDEAGEQVELRLPLVFEWVMALGQSELVSDGSRPTPLVFDGEARLYLTRYYRYQKRLANHLRRRAAAVERPAADPVGLGRHIERLFGDGVRTDRLQAVAVATAALRKLTVITGGPGTGKTTTVARILALLSELALAADRPPLRISLLAPTGKAAARLKESLRAGLERLNCPDSIKAAIPTEAATIHRALGFRPGEPTQFAHGDDERLAADVVLVDEASMVDLALMCKLFDAIPEHASVILLGDKDQLASVEAGAILGDICHLGGKRRYSAEFVAQLGAALDLPEDIATAGTRTSPGIWDCIVELRHSYRFDQASGIGRLAAAVNAGRGDLAVEYLSAPSDGPRNDELGERSGSNAGAPASAAAHGSCSAVELVELIQPEQLDRIIADRIIAQFEAYLRCDDPADRLQRLASYRLLCAHRLGAFGTERLNTLIEAALVRNGLISGRSPWYDGRPIMVTRNDYQIDLFNGDVGLIQRRRSDGRTWAMFALQAGGLRAVSPARLPPHESVFAMTVHKSQGSEFERVGLLLPPQLSPILTRELIYTGITRARSHVTLFGNAEVLRSAIELRVERASGLTDALWGVDGAR